MASSAGTGMAGHVPKMADNVGAVLFLMVAVVAAAVVESRTTSPLSSGLSGNGGCGIAVSSVIAAVSGEGDIINGADVAGACWSSRLSSAKLSHGLLANASHVRRSFFILKKNKIPLGLGPF